MTPDAIDRITAQDAHALAVIDGGRHISRARLRRELACMTAALQDLGVSAGTRVAVACEHAYVHWLVLLACERLGAVSDAVLDPRVEDWTRLHARADLFLATFRPPAMRCHHHLIDQAWLDHLFSRLDLPRVPPLPHDPARPVRVAHTAAITGAPLRLLLTRSDFAHRAGDWGRLLRLDAGSRFLLTFQPSASSAGCQAAACMQAGAVLVFAPPARAWQAIAAHGVTHTVALPGMVGQWLAELPPGFARPASLRMLCTGAPVSPPLRALALQRLATSLQDLYASNEAGILATGEALYGGGAATLLPGVRAQVVDDTDRPVPAAQAGRLRVHTACMAHSYQDAPAASAAHFRDGWFYPGDRATLDGDTLRNIGRESEVMNLGGLKVSPECLEARLCVPGIPADELAVCSLPDAAGHEVVWVALCATAAARQTLVIEAVVQLAGDYPWVSFHVIRLPALPPKSLQSESRQALRDLVAAQRDALASGPAAD